MEKMLPAIVGACLGIVLCFACFAYVAAGLTWLDADRQPGRLTKHVQNPEILPWWWRSSNAGGLYFNIQAYLCVVDMVTGHFVPLGTMDTGRRTLREVAAYKPTVAFLWQCPPGTIVELSAAEVEEVQAEVRAVQEKTAADAARHQRAQTLTRTKATP